MTDSPSMMSCAAANTTECTPRHVPRERGFAMMEVLVTLALVLVGLLGLVGLHARAHQGEMEAYQRTQALLLVRDMVDRISTHRMAAACFGGITTGTGSPYVGTGSAVASGLNCTATGTYADAAALAAIVDWDGLLKGVAEKSGTTNVGGMIDAVGCVSGDPGGATTPDAYTVAVAWRGLSDLPLLTPPNDAANGEKNAAACGQGYFNNELRRRVVWTTVEIGKLR